MKSHSHVLVVDDTKANIDILLESLNDGFEVSVALDGESALSFLESNKPDIILLDIMMPGMNGYEVCKLLKSTPETANIPIIFLTAMSNDGSEEEGLRLGAVDYITKPFNPTLVNFRVKNQLELKQIRDNLEEIVEERTAELRLTQEITIDTLAYLAEFRDQETGMHIKRTQNYVKLLAIELQKLPDYANVIDKKMIYNLYIAAPLHDIGKVAIPDKILRKPGRLTNEEFEIMKSHSEYGEKVIRRAEKKLGVDSFLRTARDVVGAHHEKWDGSGYPLGLKGDAIPLAARLMAIADVYDALRSKRVYKESMSHDEAVRIIIESKGTHFDPTCVYTFEMINDEFKKISEHYWDTK